METFEQIQPLPDSIYMELITEGERQGLEKGELRGKLKTAYRFG